MAKREPATKDHSLQGEYTNIGLLLVLYILQAIPMGLFGVVNMEVKDIFKNSFSEQGTFMLAAWPFSLKLLWAPLVDTWFLERIGRRKTWMVPAQLGIGVILLYLASCIEALFAAKDVTSLTVIFLALYFLCATQDIAVDGWALTMLRAENAGYASTCNAVGQTVGFTIGFMVPMAKIVTLPSFIHFFGIVFIVTTLLVWWCKGEVPVPKDEQLEGPHEAYSQMLMVLRRPLVRTLMVHLLTRALPFIPADVMAAGRLQDSGFSKESLASIKLFVTPLEIVMPWFLSKVTAGPRPLSVVVYVFLPRALLTPLCGLFAYAAGDIATPAPGLVYAGVFALTVLQGAVSNAMFVAHMAFFAKISDPAIGGTYMTSLNTAHNIGNMWASTFCLKVADHITWAFGYDGFYVLCGLCVAYAGVWYLLMEPKLQRLQAAAVADWRGTAADLKASAA